MAKKEKEKDAIKVSVPNLDLWFRNTGADIEITLMKKKTRDILNLTFEQWMQINKSLLKARTPTDD